MNKSIEKTIPELNGKIISTNPTIGYEVMETIVYYDMPLLTLDKNEAGQKSLTVWMDVDHHDTCQDMFYVRKHFCYERLGKSYNDQSFCRHYHKLPKP